MSEEQKDWWQSFTSGFSMTGIQNAFNTILLFMSGSGVSVFLAIIVILAIMFPERFQFLKELKTYEQALSVIKFVWDQSEGFLETRIGPEKAKAIDQTLDQLQHLLRSKDTAEFFGSIASKFTGRLI